MREPVVVIGLGFGDEGKGMAVAHECERIINEGISPMVVRFNGGPQAAHNVRIVRDDRVMHHVHSQIGSGAMLGASTVLANGMLVDPLALENEATAFARLMRDPLVLSKVYMDRYCPVVMPSHVDVNRALERMRGDGRHGSTGRGVGIARMCEAHAKENGIPVLTFHELLDERKSARQIAYWREWMSKSLGITVEWSLDTPEDEAWIMRHSEVELFRNGLNLIDDAARFIRDHHHNGIVFEGSQGMLLDERYGWFPHVTYGDMTPAGAIGIADCPVRVLGVTRSYQTRHGAGPMPTEGTFDMDEPDNGWSEWAGDFRTGLLDIKQMLHMACFAGADEIAISHMDRYPGRIVCGYDGDFPITVEIEEDGLIDTIEGCGVRVSVIGRGNTLQDWKERN